MFSYMEAAEGFSWAGLGWRGGMVAWWQGGKEARKVERAYIDTLFSSSR